jgi:hypothetical protein
LLCRPSGVFFWPDVDASVFDKYAAYGEVADNQDVHVAVRQLEDIAALHKSGALTDDEYETEKRRILDGL